MLFIIDPLDISLFRPPSAQAIPAAPCQPSVFRERLAAPRLELRSDFLAVKRRAYHYVDMVCSRIAGVQNPAADLTLLDDRCFDQIALFASQDYCNVRHGAPSCLFTLGIRRLNVPRASFDPTARIAR